MINFVSIKILITLMDGKVHSAKNLAEENEVSTKTIQRAITTLESAGVFITSTKGKNGGYSIDASSIPHLLSLSPKELGELMSICKFKESILPCSNTFASMQGAIMNSTPTTCASKILRSSSKIVLDSLPWGKQKIDTVKTNIIYNAASNAKKLEVDYVSYSGLVSHRTICPYCLTFKDGTWYTYAEDESSKQMKLFKLSRMSNIIATNKTFEERSDVNVNEMPWNGFESTNEIDVTLEVKNTCIHDIKEWLDLEIIKSDSNHTLAKARVKDNLGFYQRLVAESSKIKLVSPASCIHTLLSLLSQIQNDYKQPAYKI